MRKKNLMMICLSFAVLSLQTGNTQGLLDELKALSAIGDLPVYLETGPVEQFSSYDRTGNNDDGFNGTYSFIRMEGDKQVIAEMTGPGVINRIWTPTPSADTIEFYFDGEKVPRIAMPFDELFTSDRFPFLSPVCGYEVGGYYCYLPIPYSKSCKVLFRGKMLFYQLQYRSYHKKTRISSWPAEWSREEKDALHAAVDLWNDYGENILSKCYGKPVMETVTARIRPGETIPLFERNSGGRIVGIEVEGLDNIDRKDNNLVLMARWDGEEEYAIHAPLKDLFGYFFGERSMRSLLAGASGNSSYIYYPMPFSGSARLELSRLGDVGVGTETVLNFRIYYLDEPRQKNEGKFYVHWRRENRPAEGQPYSILSGYEGKGHYVGTILACQGLLKGTTGYFEGDDQTITDGKLRLHGTGSEDYFNGGWYLIPDRWDMAHSMPTHGCLGYVNALSRTGGFRHYLADKLNFNEDFSLTIEHGPEGNRFPVDYRSVAFFYGEYPVSQEDPAVALVSYPEPPALKYQAYLLNILAFRNGVLENGNRIGRKRVLTLKTGGGNEPMLMKVSLEAPDDGVYKLYASYYKGPGSGQIRFKQRQVILTDWINVQSPEYLYIEKEYIGNLQVRNGSATLTIHLQGNAGTTFYLNEIQMEKMGGE
ncbi:MAG TPA: DUF2961 domain-containing protein [Bacteroidetes bacterium]|nr:DUF2961 domain-containing protein [Bacteroidota bacterium]